MRAKKYTGGSSLQKVPFEVLPEYITSNLDMYKEWLD